MHKAKSYIAVLATLVAASSCSDQPEDDKQQTQAVFTISARQPAPALDAAVFLIPSATTDNELINSWTIVFADQSGIVRSILTGNPTSAVEMDQFTAKLDRGTYTVYSYANFDPASLKMNFAVGQPVPEEAKATLLSIKPEAWTAANNRIPMAGLQTVTVTQQVTQPFSVEVVRTVAKMEFMFSNATESPITLHQMWMRPMGAGSVSLYPDYTTLGQAPVLCEEADTTTVCRNLGNAELQASAERGVSHLFYTLESRADLSHPTGHYVILLDLTHRSGESGIARRDTVTMLTPELTYINRNDYIRIPVRLADYVVKIDVKFYPPIGGYPAVVNEMKGSDYYVRFGTEGLFSITPLMRKGEQGAPWLQPSQLKIDIVSTEDPEGILSGPVIYDNSTGEITGELKATKGTAVITLAVGLKDSQLSYQRKIYIIREDKK